MIQNRFSPKLVVGIILALFFGIALYLRIALPYAQVFSGDWIKFTGIDPYYHSLSTRLYNFDGKAVTPQSSMVISYEERVSQEGKAYKQITSTEQFDSYEEAEAYVSSQKVANYKIVGTNPFITPVLLDALKHYKLIHSSDNLVMQPGVGMLPEVKIFEYVGVE